MEHLGRIIRSAVHHFETHHQEGIFARLSDVSKAAIDQLLAAEEPESAAPELDDNEAVSFSDLKADPGTGCRELADEYREAAMYRRTGALGFGVRTRTCEIH
jgi:hypothetical protein